MRGFFYKKVLYMHNRFLLTLFIRIGLKPNSCGRVDTVERQEKESQKTGTFL